MTSSLEPSTRVFVATSGGLLTILHSPEEHLRHMGVSPALSAATTSSKKAGQLTERRLELCLAADRSGKDPEAFARHLVKALPRRPRDRTLMGTFQTRPEWYGQHRPARRPAVDQWDETEWTRDSPSRDHPQRPCGARRPSGLACGAPMDHGAIVCSGCAGEVFRREFERPQRRLWVMRQIGQSELLNARRHAAGAEKEAARQLAADRAAQREAAAVHVVYYLRTAPTRIKIGTTGDLARRLRDYRTDASFLLAVEPGGRDLEQQRHDELRRWRIDRRREDYAEGPEVLARVHAVRSEHGDPTAFLDRSPESEAG